MQYLASITDNFVFTWDLGIVVFLAIAVFFYGLNIGRKRLIAFFVSVYLSVVLIGTMPYLETATYNMTEGQKLGVEIALFVGTTLLLSFLLSGSILWSALRISGKEESPWWHSFILSFVTAGFLISSILALLPASYYNNFSVLVKELFIFNDAHFWWAVLGIVTLVLLRRTKHE